MANNWRIYGRDTIACKLSKAELPGFFQKKITVGPQEAALIVKNGKIQETVTQSKEVVLGFWERLKSVFLIDTEVDVYIVDITPVDIVIFLGKTDKGGGSADAKTTGPTGTNGTIFSKNDSGARAAGMELTGPGKTATDLSNMNSAFQAQRDISSLTIMALSADHEVITAECRLKISIAVEDIRLLSNILRGRAALSTWDITALIKDELLAKILLPQIGKLRSEEFRGNRELLKKMEDDVTQEMQRTFSAWGITLENFVINWGLTEPEVIELDKKRQQREEEAINFTHKRHLADMQRNLDIDLTRVDNLKQLKIAEAKGDEDLKAVYVSGEVNRANILDGKRLNVAQIDIQIATLQLSVRREEKDIEFEFEKRRKELDAELERKEMENALNAFEVIQKNKKERQKQEQDFMTQQMNIQTGSIERLASQGIEKGVVDGATLQEIARQQTAQRALDRSDAKVDSTSKADAAKANVNTFKDAEDRERKHQVDMTGQSAKMMESAKQNVPETLVQGGGITPKVNLSIPAGQPDDKQYGGLKCRKCNYSLQAGWKSCPFCGEPVLSIPPKCGCGASLEAGWKICPFCGKPIV
jgi:hypothetical protein